MLSSRKELTADARELKGELYCLPCHDKMGVPICGACRRPIEGRVVNALGKQWHVEVSEARLGTTVSAALKPLRRPLLSGRLLHARPAPASLEAEHRLCPAFGSRPVTITA